MSNRTTENKIEINRICTLKAGDSFLYDGCWRTVINLRDDSIRFKCTFGSTHVKNIGTKSQLYVQINRRLQPKAKED